MCAEAKERDDEIDIENAKAKTAMDRYWDRVSGDKYRLKKGYPVRVGPKRYCTEAQELRIK